MEKRKKPAAGGAPAPAAGAGGAKPLNPGEPQLDVKHSGGGGGGGENRLGADVGILM